MNYIIPSYIKKRIKEQPPANMHIVNGSTPVVAFGNPNVSCLATIGINPSVREFIDKFNNEFTENRRRFETLTSLNIKNISDINEQQVKQILETCYNYFHCKYPNRRWFNKLEKVIKHFQVSYYTDTACHLDLVQWATEPIWRYVPESVREILIENDRDFLLNQINNQDFKILLLNGIKVINEFKSTFNCCLDKYTELEECNKDRKLTCDIYYVTLYNKIKVIGLSRNLPSYKGITNTFIEKIAQTVSSL